MNQGITHQMETDLLRDRTHLLDDFSKQTKIHPLSGSQHFRAETALKIADIADLDVDLGKSLHAPKLPRLGAPPPSQKAGKALLRIAYFCLPINRSKLRKRLMKSRYKVSAPKIVSFRSSS